MTNFQILKIEDDLEEFRYNIDAIDIDKVKRETVRKAANEMAEMVRQAVIAEDDIISPAFNGPHERGPGPSMSQKNAWKVHPQSDGSYIVKPHPKVEQRAYVLNYGWGEITPNTADVLRFTINGIPVYRESVSGPDRTGYWQAALTRMEKSGEFERIGEREIRKEIEEQF